FQPELAAIEVERLLEVADAHHCVQIPHDLFSFGIRYLKQTRNIPLPSPGVTDRGAAPARLVFVPGMKPKPPPGAHARLILRVLGAALSRVRPGAARLLEEHPERFTLIAWTYRFYQRHRDTALDAAGVERLLADP